MDNEDAFGGGVIVSGLLACTLAAIVFIGVVVLGRIFG
jgi:hypothetical protein